MSHLPALSACKSDKGELEVALATLLEPSPALTVLSDELSGAPELLGKVLTYPGLIDLGFAQIEHWTATRKANFISGHPRIGETKKLSALSSKEQASESTPPEVLERLRDLNEQYERRYPGLRYITFVNGRSRAQVADELEDMLGRGGSGGGGTGGTGDGQRGVDGGARASIERREADCPEPIVWPWCLVDVIRILLCAGRSRLTPRPQPRPQPPCPPPSPLAQGRAPRSQGGLCIYYNQPRGCFAGNSCKFLHGDAESLTPYDSNKLCRYYISGFCKHGDRCWFRHEKPPEAHPIDHAVDDDDEQCSICLEKPIVYGLLTGCSHVFCLSCLKSWRDPQHAGSDVAYSGVNKLCPMCRNVSRFVIPSSIFYKSSDPLKDVVVERYKESMKKVRCRYFETSPSNKRFCPFGKDCFYKHQDENGQEFVFDKGVEDCMRAFKRDGHGSARHWARSVPLEERQEVDDEVPEASSSLPTDSSVASLVQSLLREVSVLASSEHAETPGVAAQLGILVSRILDLQTGEPGADDDDVLEIGSQLGSLPSERDGEGITPQTTSISRRTSLSTSASLSLILPEDSASTRGDDHGDNPHNPRSHVYSTFVVGSPRHRVSSTLPEGSVRACWEDESDDELNLRSPSLVPLPDSPASSHSKRRQSYPGGHVRQSSSMHSHLALATPPNMLLVNSNEPEDQERTEIIRSSILVSPSAPASVASSVSASPSSAHAEEYCNEDHDMENLVRSIHRTLLNQSND